MDPLPQFARTRAGRIVLRKMPYGVSRHHHSPTQVLKFFGPHMAILDPSAIFTVRARVFADQILRMFWISVLGATDERAGRKDGREIELEASRNSFDFPVGKMSFGTEEDSASEIHLPAEIDWQMLDKSKFFFLGAGLFSGVSAILYPVVVLKTRQQICKTPLSCGKTAFSIVRNEGLRGFYRGFGTSLLGTVPARALYMTALEITKSNVGTATVSLGFAEPAAATIANAAAGLSAAVAAQLIWTPVDVISQRLMVQGPATICNYRGGVDAFTKILTSDGLRGLYRGFGMSIATYAPSNAAWWASYSLVQRVVWGGFGWFHACGWRDEATSYRPDLKTVMAVQGLSASMAGGVSALITTPLDTIKTRLQVLEGEEVGGRRRAPSVVEIVRNLVKEGGWMACYRGLGPRWASMSMSATTMITTYEFLKRLSAKSQEILA